MKCDELKPYVCGGWCCEKEAYPKDKVDAAIAELKQTIDKLVGVKKSAEQILQNLLDCGLIKEWFYNGTFHAVLKADDPHLQIAELKKKLMPCLNGDCILTCEVVEKYGKENAELKKKLEDVQASHYAEIVDAGMRERRLRRALWLARALRARDIQRWWIAATCSPRTEVACIRWNNIERKCRAKAEQYK